MTSDLSPLARILRAVLIALVALAAGGASAQEAVAPDSLGAGEAPVLLQEAPTGAAAAEPDAASPDTASPEAAAESPEASGEETEHKGWLSLLPALLAIVAALVFRQVIVALFLGVWLGAAMASGDGLIGVISGLFATVDTYILGALADSDKAAILLFTLLIGGTVGVIQKNGGTRAIVNLVTKWARSAGRGQLATALLGTAVFFDDYANTLIVGGTMRPITDKLNVSREKLAYIVDSTAAPIACIAFVTTWIGYEVGLIGDAVEGIPGLTEGAYSIFLNSIPYSFYPLLALFFVYAVATTKRDFGPMLKAERRARQTGQLSRPGSSVDSLEHEERQLDPPEDKPMRLVNSVLPILTLVVTVLVGLWVTGIAEVREAGDAETIRNVIGKADSYKAMMWGALLSCVVAVLLSVGQRILTLTEAMEAWYIGMRSMLLALAILVLAWALGNVNDALGTGPYLVEQLSGTLAPWMVPGIVFILAAATAFSTGSSWGTMGILTPLVIPLVWGVMTASGGDPDLTILYSTVSCILAGAVWGDHCSPISDTTILSSLASQCDHVDHVRTQLPYALTVGGVSLVLGTVPAALGAPWWLMMPLCAALLFGILHIVGKPVDEPEPVSAA